MHDQPPPVFYWRKADVMEDISNIVGEKIETKNLKPLANRLRNRLLKAVDRQPWVHLLIGENGSKYKLLKIDDKSNKRLNQILKLKPRFDSLDFVPKIIWSDEYLILMKFIDGVFPEFGDERFSKEFAKNLAVLHKTNVGKTDKDKYLKGILKKLDFLYAKKAISERIKDKCHEEIMSRQPDELRTSMTYSNMHNEKNFVFDINNKLWFIDLGSFKESRVTDDALFGYKLFKSIDRRVFWKSYFENGGTEYIKENEKFLRITQLVRKGAWHLKKSYDLSYVYLRSKRSRHKKAKWMVSELVREIDRVDN